jgi:hypothetical protein
MTKSLSASSNLIALLSRLYDHNIQWLYHLNQEFIFGRIFKMTKSLGGAALSLQAQ